MRALNFFFIFLICLALVFFSIENTQPTAIQVIKGVQVKAPLCVELIVATGLGAILAWLFSLWSRMQRTPRVAPTDPPSSRKRAADSGIRTTYRTL
jgi:putative membrane protein